MATNPATAQGGQQPPTGSQPSDPNVNMANALQQMNSTLERIINAKNDPNEVQRAAEESQKHLQQLQQQQAQQQQSQDGQQASRQHSQGQQNPNPQGAPQNEGEQHKGQQHKGSEQQKTQRERQQSESERGTR